MTTQKNKVVKWWPVQPIDGNLQYWDGNQWVVLSNGLLDQVLTTHATSNGPTWEFLPGESPLSSSSSSSGEDGGPSGGNINFNMTAANGGTGGGTGTNLFSGISGDVHLTMGGDKDPALAVGRDGVSEADTPFIFNSSWNFDDNGGANEIYFLGVESPITNKLSTIQYSQKTGPFPALCLSVITVKSEELNASSSGTPTGVCSLIGNVLAGDGEFNIVFDSSSNVTMLVTGSYWDGGTSQPISTSIAVGGTFKINVNDIECVISGDSRDAFVFFGLTPTIPPGKIWHEIAAAGGRFGGMWWDILNKIRCYSDGLEDRSGHPTLTALYGNPPSSSSSSKHVSVLGVWGWFGNETQTPGTSHFIPLNFDSPDPNMDVASGFLGVPRSTYESLSLSTASIVETLSFHDTSVARMDALALTYDLLYENNGLWELQWIDRFLRLDGEFMTSDDCTDCGANCNDAGSVNFLAISVLAPCIDTDPPDDICNVILNADTAAGPRPIGSHGVGNCEWSANTGAPWFIDMTVLCAGGVWTAFYGGGSGLFNYSGVGDLSCSGGELRGSIDMTGTSSDPPCDCSGSAVKITLT